jgi:hypothetical protein
MSSSSSTTNRRPSYVLTYEPPKFSLSAGTAFEVPAEELERLPLEPFPAVDAASSTQAKDAAAAAAQQKKADAAAITTPSRSRADSARQPLSPTSESTTNESSSSKPRKLFSLRSLRKSFSSSRGSLNLARTSQDTLAYHPTSNNNSRPQSPGYSIVSSSTTSQSQSHHQQQPSPQQSQQQQQPTQPQPPRSLRNKRSSTWFGQRRSGFFHVNEDGMLDVVAEDPGTEGGGHSTKRVKDKDAPELPEITALEGERSHEIGWDEGMFRKGD